MLEIHRRPGQESQNKDGKETGKTARGLFGEVPCLHKAPVEKENCGRINKEALKNFDVVLFSPQATGHKEELADLREWVKAGGGSRNPLCYGHTLRRIGLRRSHRAYFKGHPPGLQKIKVKLEDPKHPAAAGFTDGMDYQDEMYVFRDAPYSRDKLHIIMSIDSGSFDPKQLSRGDKDYAISWCRTKARARCSTHPLATIRKSGKMSVSRNTSSAVSSGRLGSWKETRRRALKQAVGDVTISDGQIPRAESGRSV